MANPIAAGEDILESNFEFYAASATGNDSYAITIGGCGATAYEAGRIYLFKADVANTGACTLNINSIGAVAIKKGGADLETGDIAAGQVIIAVFDGTYFQLIQGGLTQLAQNINGVKTFASIPVGPASDPTTDNQFVRKHYADMQASLGTLATASDTLKHSADTERSQVSNPTLTLIKSIRVNHGGSIRVKFDMKTSEAPFRADGRIYVNGVATGTARLNQTTSYITYSEDLSGIKDYDLIQLYIAADGSPGKSCYVSNFRIYYDVSLSDGVVVTD